MNNLIVTHKSPDLDAIASIWLLKRFNERYFDTAEIAFVNPGDTITIDELSQLGDTSYEITHVDTGGGEFDHHTDNFKGKRTCAADLVYQHLQDLYPQIVNDDALALLIEHVIDIDLFLDSQWEERGEKRHFFSLSQIMAQLKSIGLTDQEVVEYGLVSLDAVHARMSNYIGAKSTLEKQSIEFESKWGKGVAANTANNLFVEIAQKSGFDIVVRKEPQRKHLQIKALPDKNIDLSQLYAKITDLDKGASWYLHPSKTMLLNGSDTQRNQIASSLSIKDVIQIINSL